MAVGPGMRQPYLLGAISQGSSPRAVRGWPRPAGWPRAAVPRPGPFRSATRIRIFGRFRRFPARGRSCAGLRRAPFPVHTSACQAISWSGRRAPASRADEPLRRSESLRAPCPRPCPRPSSHARGASARRARRDSRSRVTSGAGQVPAGGTPRHGGCCCCLPHVYYFRWRETKRKGVCVGGGAFLKSSLRKNYCLM